MVTVGKIERTLFEPNGEEKVLVELRGLSTDTKPTELDGQKIENGSTFIEIDTGKIYMYDLANEDWKEI